MLTNRWHLLLLGKVSRNAGRCIILLSFLMHEARGCSIPRGMRAAWRKSCSQYMVVGDLEPEVKDWARCCSIWERGVRESSLT